MSTTREYPALQAAFNAESWQYLQDEWPDMADALAVEVGRGATAADLRRFTLRHTGRVQLAQRIEQAAAHLLAQRQGGAA